MQNQASEKLDQVIYTRCKPHRDLKNNGQVVHSDGFGIFSMNRELLNKSQSVNFDMLQTSSIYLVHFCSVLLQHLEAPTDQII